MAVEFPLDNYFNRFDPDKNYELHLVRAGFGTQSAEINEIQSNLIHRTRGIADSLFRDGDIIRDCQIVLDQETGFTSMAGGALYLQGAVRGVAPATFTIPIDTVVDVGIRLIQTVITELEDPDLRDPATGTRNYNEPGAGRLQVEAIWGWDGDGGDGDFFGVYTVDNGVLLSREAPPQLDSVTNAIARYDRDSAGGNYIVVGLSCSAAYDRVTDQVAVLVGEGRARASGFPIEVPRSIRFIYDADPDLRTVISEPHTFTPDGAGKMRVNLNASPLIEIISIRITAQRTVTLTHGAFGGAKDPLPENSVQSIIEVRQGATVFVQGVDFQLTNNSVDWSLAGAEPAPGSTYQVTFRFLTDIVTITGKDDTGFTLDGAVTGSLFTVDYTFALGRVDSMVVDAEGRISRIKGVSNQYNPVSPSVPDTQLRICSIVHNWSSDPIVVSDGVTVLPMQDLQAIRGMVFDLFDLVAQERLRTDIGLSDTAAKRGVFVDPFTNDNLRDAGLAQNIAIIDGEIMLPIDPTVTEIATNITTPQLLPYVLEAIVDQPFRTTSMKVNPYQAYEPLPATINLAPGVDFWTDLNVVWLSETTRRFVNTRTGINIGSSRIETATSSSVQSVSTRAEPAQFLRQIVVGFTIDGFGAGEILQSLSFDGIPVTPEAP